MPAYITEPTTNQWPPVTIPVAQPGLPCYSFGRPAGYSDAPTINTEFSETMPANGTAGRQFALRSFGGTAIQPAREIMWDVSYPGGAPATVDVRLQGAMRDVDAEYYDIDSTTNVAGEKKQSSINRVNFLRIIVHSSTGATDIVAKLLV